METFTRYNVEWRKRTNLGRIVYERAKHIFIAKDAERILHHLLVYMTDHWGWENDPKFNDIWAWEHMSDVVAYALKALYRPSSLPDYPRKWNETLKIYPPTPLHWTAARLIYYIEQITALIEVALGMKDLPFVSEVWKIGSWVLKIVLEGLKDKMGGYSYSPGPPETLVLN
jgi:hypothetical protein